MRGKGLDKRRTALVQGITPAYAGKRIFCSDSDAANEDHPRLCGEKRLTLPKGKKRLGSPPPMRGKELLEALEDTDDRITPAYAGKSARPPAVSSPRRDHPRLCGEKGSVYAQSWEKAGSPPPMRGKVIQ